MRKTVGRVRRAGATAQFTPTPTEVTPRLPRPHRQVPVDRAGGLAGAGLPAAVSNRSDRALGKRRDGHVTEAGIRMMGQQAYASGARSGFLENLHLPVCRLSSF